VAFLCYKGGELLMKKFTIVLNSGKSTTLKAIDDKDLFRKIRMERYGRITRRFNEIITEQNIKEIIEEN